MPGRGKPFEPGNKLGRGRPRGRRNKTTVMAQQLLDSHAESLARKCLVSALQGDSKAMHLCLDRVLPARRELPVKIGKLPLGTAAELSQASELVTQKVAAGQLTASQGHAIAELIERRRKVLETEDLDRRLQALEGKQ
jgi:hypothetical protein